MDRFKIFSRKIVDYSNGLFFSMNDLKVIKSAELTWQIIQDVNNVNELIYNNKKLLFNLNGFFTDLRSFLKHKNNHALAYIIHDYLYSSNNITFSRKESDKIMKVLLIHLHKNYLLAVIEYLGVRLFGNKYFKGGRLVILRICINGKIVVRRLQGRDGKSLNFNTLQKNIFK